MAKRNTLLLFTMFILTGSFWAFASFLLAEKPMKIMDLEEEQKILNEKLISAQILANKLDRVFTLFQENLALSIADSLAEDASLPFLNNLTAMLQKHDIKLLSIKPKNREKKGVYYSSPYEIEIECTYDQLGKFIAETERSPRLISVDEFVIKNGIERVKNVIDNEQLRVQAIEMQLSTLTLLKMKKN